MLKLKKTKKSEEEQTVTKAHTSLLSIAIKAWALAAVVLMGLAVVAYMMLDEIIREKQFESDEAYVKQVSYNINTWLNAYVDSVNAMANDPAQARLLAQGGAAEVLARQRELAQALGAVRVLLIVDGMESRRLGQYPLLSYAELDMILEAKNGRLPAVEAHQPEGSGGHFDVVRPIKSNGQTVGYLLASFDNKALLAELRNMVAEGGKLELFQRVAANEEKMLVALGAVDSARALSLTYPVAGARWQLRYWSPKRVWHVFGVDWRVTFWTTFAEVLAVMALMIAIFRRYLQGVLKADAALFYTFIRDRVIGQWMGKSYVPRLKEFDTQLQKLKSLNLTPQASLRRVPRKKSLPAKKGESKTEKPGKTQRAAQKQAEMMAFDESYADLIYQDENKLSVTEETPSQPEAPVSDSTPNLTPAGEGGSVPRSIFRAYDIRGVVDETLTPEVAHQIGLAIGSEAWVRGEQSVVVGRDGRLSGPKLCEALIQGIRDSGRDVIDIGRVPTPVLYFATHYLSTRSGVMVTGSHNPSQYNGFKIVLKGEALSGGAIKSLYSRIANKDFTMGEGTLTSQDIQSDYIARVIADVSVKRPLRVVVDCGNGVAGDVAPTVLRGLGCDVIELHCEVDGHFPNHHPDPSQPENLIDLVEAVREHSADVGLAFDGDGDRLGVVDSDGNIIWPDRQLILFARDVLKHHSGGQVIYDVKCSRYLQSDIEEHGGVALMWKSGHSLMRGKLQEMQGVLAGEMSGHIFFNDRWYGFDDGIYTAARLIEILSAGQHSSAQIFASLPHAISTPELRIELPEGKSVELMKRLQDRAHFNGAELIYIDGIRAEFDGGWGLVRASNTTPALTLRFEADDAEWLAHIQSVFKEELQALAPNLALPI